MMTTRLAQTALLLRTVRHLRSSQVGHRLRLRAQRSVTGRFPTLVERRLAHSLPSRPGWPNDFTPLDAALARGFPSPAANVRGEFRFLERTRSLGTPHDWEQADAEQLWRYHVHYFEWAWSFLYVEDRDGARDGFGALWRSWNESVGFGRGDAWSPYVASLRAWVLCGLYSSLVVGAPIEQEYLSSIAVHAGYVRTHLELDVGGNHLLKNLKALVGLGVFLEDDRLVRDASERIERELAVQVLADGGHYERSPSYHCQVLGDLLDIAELVAKAGRPVIPGIQAAIDGMQKWLGAVLLPDGDVPLFNDCVLVGTDRIALLSPAPPSRERLVVLQPSGYVVVRPNDDVHIVMDVGPPCPPDLPAHAHADCLSFELSVRGERVIVDSGTSTYQEPTRRAFERSTAAHNTIEIDGTDQTEVWGAFRAARRANGVLEKAEDDGEAVVVVASHDGYERLSGRPRHRRTWQVSADGLTLVDDIEGAGVHTLASRFHLAPGTDVVHEGGDLVAGPLLVRCPDGDPVVCEAGVATDFGTVQSAHVVVVELTAPLPVTVTVDLRVKPAVPRPLANTSGQSSKHEASS